jgi:hypothetical protein
MLCIMLFLGAWSVPSRLFLSVPCSITLWIMAQSTLLAKRKSEARLLIEHPRKDKITVTVTDRRPKKRGNRDDMERRAGYLPPFKQAEVLKPFLDLANVAPADAAKVALSSPLLELRELAKKSPERCADLARFCAETFTMAVHSKIAIVYREVSALPSPRRKQLQMRVNFLQGITLDDLRRWGRGIEFPSGAPTILNGATIQFRIDDHDRIVAKIDNYVVMYLAALTGADPIRIRRCHAHRLDGSVCNRVFYARRLKTDACSLTCQATTRQTRRRDKERHYNQSKKESFLRSSREPPRGVPAPDVKCNSASLISAAIVASKPHGIGQKRRRRGANRAKNKKVRKS